MKSEILNLKSLLAAHNETTTKPQSPPGARHLPLHHPDARRPRRPPRPNYLAIACTAFNKVIKLDKRLRPFMDEQSQMLARWLRDQEVRAALRKVYGDDDVEALPSPPVNLPTATDVKLLLKHESALAKSRLLLDRLKSRMRENW